MLKQATLGAGCFWCVEAIFKNLKGVVTVEPGYTGGQSTNPTYDQVCGGQTGHAEVCRISYKDEIVSFEQLLEVFWLTHDPTTLNKQGADVGTQYRSVIYFHDEEQEMSSRRLKAELDQSQTWSDPIVTEIAPLGDYYPAETYHRDYFERNSEQSYCSVVIKPKLDKFRKIFADRVQD